jgi:hypothetical protein
VHHIPPLVLVNHVGKIIVRNEINIEDPVRQEFKPDPAFELHLNVIDRDVVPIFEILVDIDVAAHFADDFKIHFPVIVFVNF